MMGGYKIINSKISTTLYSFIAGSNSEQQWLDLGRMHEELVSSILSAVGSPLL
jgi:hypothetical protein